MTIHSRVSRKDVGEDRIAICPIFGCKSMIRVKPLKFGFFGFGKYPRCKKHNIPLVYIDERIGEFVDGALACLFDKKALPSNDLLSMIASEYPDEIQTFVQGWVYCITTGQGAPIVSRYLDSISKTYLKKLNRKQIKALNNEASGKYPRNFQVLRKGLKELTKQYARLLKHLRVHTEVLVNTKTLKSLSSSLRYDLKKWQDGIIKDYLRAKPSEQGAMNSLMEIKNYYDHILNIGTCRCLIGMNVGIKEVKVTAFDRFSAYMEFFSEGITTKFTKSDLEKLDPSRQLNKQFHNNGSELVNNKYEIFLNPNNNQFCRRNNLEKYHKDYQDESCFKNAFVGYNSFRESKITVREQNALTGLDTFLESKKDDILRGIYIPTISKVKFDYSDSSLIKYHNIKSHIRRWLTKNTPFGSITSLKSYFGKTKPKKVYKPQLGYDTLQFIEDIRNEIQKYPIILSQIFPDRTKRYSYKDLSLYWQGEENYIKNLKRRRGKFQISHYELSLLLKKLKNDYNDQDMKEISALISSYLDGNLGLFSFLKKLNHQIGCRTTLRVTDTELGIIMKGQDYFVTDKVYIINNQYPKYKFSVELLDFFEENIKSIFGQKGHKIYGIIKKYKELNPKLKYYSHQQFDLHKPNIFREIDSVEKAYWFGFLHADGWVEVKSDGYRIGLELSSKDKKQVEAFASFIGAFLKDVKDRVRLRLYKGDIRKYEMSYLKKGCKPLVEDLVDKGFIDLKNGNEGIPRFVKRLLFNVKKYRNWRNTKQAKIAFAWLLGFFDGDGTLTNPNRGRIYSNNSKLLREIKLFFEIEYDVIINHDGQEIEFVTNTSDSNFIVSSPQFSLLLDEKTFIFMKNSYSKGLARKRKK